MFRDANLITNIQIALIGIIVVVGLFYVWKAINRIEAKLQTLSTQVCMQQQPPPEFFDSQPITEEEAAEAEAFMTQVFGSCMRPAESSAPGVIVEEEAPCVASSPNTEPTPSEAESTNHLSKTRLKKMNADQLRDLCAEHGLPTEGTRAMLIERLNGANL